MGESTRQVEDTGEKNWSHSPDLNRRPAVYETAALPTELLWPSPLLNHNAGRAPGLDLQRQRDLVQGARVVRIEAFLGRQARREDLRGHNVRNRREPVLETPWQADPPGSARLHLAVS